LSTTLSASSSGAATSSSLTKKRQRTTADLIHWRRSQVVKLLSQGLTIDQTAEKLQVSPKTVQRDYAYIRRHSHEVLRNYFVDTLPNEVLKNIARLTAVSDSAWAMATRSKEKGSDKLEADALRLANYLLLVLCSDTLVIIVTIILVLAILLRRQQIMRQTTERIH
jgi:hypothetical protein